jgi:pimeloyl-ACP methyl ester carboxylesterase
MNARGSPPILQPGDRSTPPRHDGATVDGAVVDREARYREAERELWTSLGVEPVERRVRLAHTGTEVRVQELGAGRPAIFLHGALTSGTSWAGLVARLPGVHCYVIDRPGTGLSDPLPSSVTKLRTLDALGDSLVGDLLDGLGLDAADVVATSFGGYFALRGALAQPHRFGRIVEFGWSAGAPLGRMPFAMRLGSLPLMAGLASRLPVNERVVRSMFRGIGLRQAIDAGRVSVEAVRAYAALLNHTDTMRNELDLGRTFVSPLRGLDRGLLLSEAARAAITQPIAFIWGERDSFGGPPIALEFVRPFQNAQLEIVPDAGHNVWIDDAELAAERVGRFLSA